MPRDPQHVNFTFLLSFSQAVSNPCHPYHYSEKSRISDKIFLTVAFPSFRFLLFKMLLVAALPMRVRLRFSPQSARRFALCSAQ
jgi:hypothetical protein